MRRSMITVGAGVLLVAGVAAVSMADASGYFAKATLLDANSTNIGWVSFKNEDAHTEIRVHLTEAPGIDAFHGFHIHANNNAANGNGCVADPAMASSTWFVSADGHFNPAGVAHAHHAGDMPSVYVNGDGSVETAFRIDRIDPGALAGKAVVFHAGADNFNNVPAGPDGYTGSAAAIDLTARTGNAGDRLACGVIELR
jgi:superoxide dismutase, Cu-Zn family